MPAAASSYGVFISYRREDAAFHAGWLYEELTARYGPLSVFKDVDSIGPGEPFLPVITRTLRSCHTLLVVIGPKWLSVSAEQAVRRIDEPKDFVRLEIEIALAHGVHVIPVLVLEATMPGEEDLPHSIADIAGRQAVSITSSRLRADLARLMDGIERRRNRTSGDPAEDPTDEQRERDPGTPPGVLADRYELGELLGLGVLSEVRHGRDRRSGGDVAVKMLRPELLRYPQFQNRFRREVQNAPVPRHPGVVALYDTGAVPSVDGPQPYTVMEFVDGLTLREIVKAGGPMDQRRAVAVTADVCSALDAGHRNDVLHRNIKPTNIMIDRAGAVKLMDFGVAGALGTDQSGAETAAVVDSAQYLSPEQARSERVDARSDVYAVGCVLFELLTGEPPFAGDSPVAVAYQHVREDPQPPSRLGPGISAALDAVVLKALSKDPANRYPSAAEMREDLLRVHNGQEPLAPAVLRVEPGLQPVGPDPTSSQRVGRGRRIVAVVGVAVAAILALVLIVSHVSRPPTGDGTTALPTAPPAAPPVVVPDLIGATQEVAAERLATAGLRVGTVRPVASAADAVGTVTATDPMAGSQVGEQTAVELSIGSGPLPPTTKVAVPPLTGLTLAGATQALTKAGLRLGTRSTADGAAGKILSSTPEAGTLVESGSAVNVAVGAQQPTVLIPDVAGQPADTAQSVLETAGFAVKRQEADSSEPVDTAVGTTPAAGKSVKKGSTVTLKVSRGSPPATVPNVIGQSASAAERTLSTAGFSVTIATRSTAEANQVGLVLAQSPGAGQEATAGDTVSITVGAEAEPP